MSIYVQAGALAIVFAATTVPALARLPIPTEPLNITIVKQVDAKELACNNPGQTIRAHTKNGDEFELFSDGHKISVTKLSSEQSTTESIAPPDSIKILCPNESLAL